MKIKNFEKISVIFLCIICLTGFSSNLPPSSAFFVSEYITEFGFEGTGNGGFKRPCDITITENRIFVADSINNNVQIFDHSLNYVDQFGSSGTGDGQFDSPCQITSNSTHVLILDRNNYRVQIFDLDGNYKAQFGEYYKGGFTELGKWETPNAINMNETHIFVSDFLTGRIHIFNLATNPVGEIVQGPHSAALGYNGSMFALATTVNIYNIYVYDSNGNLQLKIDQNVYPFIMLGDIIFKDNFIIAAEVSFNSIINRIVVINLNNNETQSFGINGSGEGEFGTIGGLGHNETHLFVTDTGNFNVKVYKMHFDDDWTQPFGMVTTTVTETITGNNTTFTTTESGLTETITSNDNLGYNFTSFLVAITVLTTRSILIKKKRK